MPRARFVMTRLLPSLLAAVAAACAGRPRALAEPGQPLRPCPGTPNCVSTEATTRTHRIAPVPFADSPESAQSRARAALLAEPRTRITLDAPGYLRAECTSRLFRFVDDVELVVDSTARVFRMRSASRLGRGDLGVNRKRARRVLGRLRGD